MAGNLQRRTRRTFAWVAVVPFLLGLTLFWVSRSYQASVASVSHTQDVLITAESLLLAVTQAESGQRGYLLTRGADFQDRYRAAKVRVEQQFSAIKSLTADNPHQQANLARLRTAIDRRIELLDSLLAEMQSAKAFFNPPANVLRDGVERMKAIRQLCDVIKAEETRLLEIRRSHQQNLAIVIAVASAGGIIVTILLLLVASRLIDRYAAERDRSEAELKNLNLELETRVEERTADLTRIAEKLSRSNQDLTQFAYVASHDLQEPLRTVASYAALLSRRYQGQLDEQADKYIGFMISGAKRMQSLVQDLLSYSKAGTQALKFEHVELESVVQGVRDSLRLVIAERRAQLTVEPLPSVEVDARRLGQVFQNLITNALKFTKPGEEPRIHVGVRRESGNWIVCVSDNGIGFESSYAERIFGIFQRLHTVGTYPGTGIGLAICKRIVEAHGGRIWAESIVNVGSKFCFTLPVAQSQTAVA